MAISLKTVKVIVFGLGALMVLAFAGVIYGLMREDPKQNSVTVDPVPTPPAARTVETTVDPGFGITSVEIKPGTVLVGTSVSDSRLALQFRVQTASGQEDRVLVVDLKTGKRLGEVRLQYTQ